MVRTSQGTVSGPSFGETQKKMPMLKQYSKMKTEDAAEICPKALTFLQAKQYIFICREVVPQRTATGI